MQQISKVLIFAAPKAAKEFFLKEQDFDCIIDIAHTDIAHTDIVPVSSPEVHSKSCMFLTIDLNFLSHDLKYICSEKLSTLSWMFDSKTCAILSILDSRNVSILTHAFRENVSYVLSFYPNTNDYHYEYIEYVYTLFSSSRRSIVFNYEINTLRDLKDLINSNQPIILSVQNKHFGMTQFNFPESFLSLH